MGACLCQSHPALDKLALFAPSGDGFRLRSKIVNPFGYPMF
jgi:hypothetical protein